MSTPVALTPAVRARVSSFSVVLGAVAVLAIGIGITIAAVSGTVVITEGERPSTSRDYYTPWENPYPMDAEQDGDTFTGRGQAVIRLSGLDPRTPLEVLWGDDADAVRGVSLRHIGARNSASRVDSYAKPGLLMPGASAVELWVHTASTAPWTLTVRPTEFPEHTGIVSGRGDYLFVYTGDATTARAVTREGILRIEAITESGRDEVLALRDAREASFAWPDSEVVIFSIRSYGDDPWSITFHESTPEPAETEGADADE